MKSSALEVAEMPPELVTVTLTVPEPAGDVAVSEVPPEFMVTFVAALGPKLTLPARLVPVTVTTVPPAKGPVLGVTAVTIGLGT